MILGDRELAFVFPEPDVSLELYLLAAPEGLAGSVGLV